MVEIADGHDRTAGCHDLAGFGGLHQYHSVDWRVDNRVAELGLRDGNLRACAFNFGLPRSEFLLFAPQLQAPPPGGACSLRPTTRRPPAGARGGGPGARATRARCPWISSIRGPSLTIAR